MLYLGYLHPEDAQKYMDRLMKPLCMAVTQYFKKLECEYTNIKAKFDINSNWVSIFFDEKTNKELKSIIIPYLDKYGIKKIDSKKFINYQPMIDLVFFKSSERLQRHKQIDIPVPTSTFMIDHISLLSATPFHYRGGYPSIYEGMIFEEENMYYFPYKS